MRAVAVILVSLVGLSHALSLADQDGQEKEIAQGLKTLLLATNPVIGERMLSRPQTRFDPNRRLTPQMKKQTLRELAETRLREAGVLARDVTIGAGATALAALMAAAFIGVGPAEAARTGGRVGGRAPRAPMRAPAPAPSVQSRTNVYVTPGVSVFPGGGYGGMGYGGYGYGGYGYGGGISTGTYLGLTLAQTFIQEQRRQAYLQEQLRIQTQLGNDQAMIANLQAQVAAQNAKVDGLRKESPNVEKDAMAEMQQQLADQKKEIEQLKSGGR